MLWSHAKFTFGWGGVGRLTAGDWFGDSATSKLGPKSELPADFAKSESDPLASSVKTESDLEESSLAFLVRRPTLRGSGKEIIPPNAPTEIRQSGHLYFEISSNADFSNSQSSWIENWHLAHFRTGPSSDWAKEVSLSQLIHVSLFRWRWQSLQRISESSKIIFLSIISD